MKRLNLSTDQIRTMILGPMILGTMILGTMTIGTRHNRATTTMAKPGTGISKSARRSVLTTTGVMVWVD